VKVRQLQPDGSYSVVMRDLGEKPFDSQTFFIHLGSAAASGNRA
jgi:hypothetical protein